MNDIEQLYAYLTSNLPVVKSVTLSNCEHINHYQSVHDIIVYTDTELDGTTQSNLNTLITNYPNPMHDINVNAFRKISNLNSTSIPLYPNACFSGHWEDISNYSTVSISISCDKDSAFEGFEIHLSQDGITSDKVKKLTVKGGIGTTNQLTVATQYFKIKYHNGSEKTNLQIQTLFHHYRNKAIGASLVEDITDAYDCEVNRSIINGRLANGMYIPVDVSSAGYLKTTLQEPLSTFGCVSVANNTPLFQHEFVYDVHPFDFDKFNVNGGSVNVIDSSCFCSSSNTYSVGGIISKRELRYRPGQGALGRFTAAFGSPYEGNEQFIGFGTFETNISFGYLGSHFGVIHTARNIKEKYTICVTEPSSNVQTAVVTLAGNSYDVPITATNTKEGTAWELSQFDYTKEWPGWNMSAYGSNIHLTCIQEGAQSNDFSVNFPISGSATITKDWSGLSNSYEFIPQIEWNIDNMDGSCSLSNPSGALLDPQKGNVYFIKFQYLGFGYIEYGLEDPISTEQISVHKIYYANHYNISSMGNPSLPFIMVSRNDTCSNAVTVQSASCAGFVQGDIRYFGYTHSIPEIKMDVESNMTYIMTIRNSMVYHNRYNMLHILPMRLNVSNFGSNFAKVFLIRYGEMDHHTNFSRIDDMKSVVEKDTSCQVITGGDIIYSTGICAGHDKDIDLSNLNLSLETGSCLSIIAKTEIGITNISCSLIVTQE